MVFCKTFQGRPARPVYVHSIKHDYKIPVSIDDVGVATNIVLVGILCSQ